MRIDTEEAKRYLDPEFINAYSLLHSQGIYEGQRAVTQEQTRGEPDPLGYAGQQRYATITWSGDIAANWETLRRQIPAGLNFCVTGLALLDPGHWSVLCQEQAGVVVLVRRLRSGRG